MIITQEDRDHARSARKCGCNHCHDWLKLYGKLRGLLKYYIALKKKHPTETLSKRRRFRG